MGPGKKVDACARTGQANCDLGHPRCRPEVGDLTLCDHRAHLGKVREPGFCSQVDDPPVSSLASEVVQRSGLVPGLALAWIPVPRDGLAPHHFCTQLDAWRRSSPDGSVSANATKTSACPKADPRFASACAMAAGAGGADGRAGLLRASPMPRLLLRPPNRPRPARPRPALCLPSAAQSWSWPGRRVGLQVIPNRTNTPSPAASATDYWRPGRRWIAQRRSRHSLLRKLPIENRSPLQ